MGQPEPMPTLYDEYTSDLRELQKISVSQYLRLQGITLKHSSKEFTVDFGNHAVVFQDDPLTTVQTVFEELFRQYKPTLSVSNIQQRGPFTYNSLVVEASKVLRKASELGFLYTDPTAFNSPTKIVAEASLTLLTARRTGKIQAFGYKEIDVGSLTQSVIDKMKIETYSTDQWLLLGPGGKRFTKQELAHTSKVLKDVKGEKILKYFPSGNKIYLIPEFLCILQKNLQRAKMLIQLPQQQVQQHVLVTAWRYRNFLSLTEEKGVYRLEFIPPKKS